MAIHPDATQDIIPAASRQPKIQPIMVILHTFVGPRGGGPGRPSGGTEWHFQIAVGGEVTQYVPTDIRADANFRANRFNHRGEMAGAISIETGDQFFDGDPHLEQSWSALGQFDALVDLVAWCCHTHDIPAELCADWNQPGIGYHSMWGFNDAEPGEGTYGTYTQGGKTFRLNNPWTSARGKTCPGPGKIGEFDRLLAAVRTKVVSVGDRTTTVLPGEGWMAIARRALDNVHRWREIRDINDGPDRILHPGDVILLPA